MTDYPEYERDAMFRCNRGCGSIRRDRCYVFRGKICCPYCRIVGTLRYQPAGRSALSEGGKTDV